MLSEGQRNDINYAIPLLAHVNPNGSNVLADRGYDCNKLIDYIYTHGGEPTIPSRKGAKFERHCDWWLYKERHLVENYFLKLKAYRRIATRYDKLASTFLGFICIASILIWLNERKLNIIQAAAVLALVVFLGIVFGSTVFTRTGTIRQYELVPFWSWRDIIRYHDWTLLSKRLIGSFHT